MQKNNYLDDSFIEEVKQSTNIVDVISKYVDLKKNGENYKGLCPFHSEKTPSFIVSEPKQIFKCFGCGESGNAISFLMKKENIGFVDAIKQLSENANIKFPENNSYSEEDKILFEKRQRQYSLHTDIAKYYFENLQNNRDNSKNYLINRGLHEKTIKKFGLGYDSGDQDTVQHLYGLGYTKKELLESKIFREKNDRLYSIFFSRVMYPIFDTKNRVIAFGGRTIENREPKYLNSPESIIFEKKNQLYGLNFARKYNSKRIILVEGYMDVISLYQNGVVGAVASLGTSLTKQQSIKIKNQNRKNFICYDTDNAGVTATLRALEILKSEGINANVIYLEGYKDPDEFFTHNKASEFMKKIDESMTPISYKIYNMSKDYNFDIYSQKHEFIDKACEVIMSSNDPIEKEFQTKNLSNITGVSIKAIGTKIYGNYFSPKQFKLDKSSENIGISGFSKIQKKEVFSINIDTINENEKKLTEIVMKKPEYIIYIMDILNKEDISDNELIKIYERYLEFDVQEIREDENEKESLQKLARLIKLDKIQNDIDSLELKIKNEKNLEMLNNLTMKRMEIIKESKDIKKLLKKDKN